MTSNRCDRKALPLDEAVRRLESGSGTQFDAKIVKHLVWMVSDELPQPSRVTEAFAIPELTLAEVMCWRRLPGRQYSRSGIERASTSN